MFKKPIINISIGASTIKLAYCEKQGVDVLVNDIEAIRSNSNLFITKDKINIGFLEDKIRLFLLKHNIRKGYVCYSLPDYMVSNEIMKINSTESEEDIQQAIERNLVLNTLNHQTIRKHSKVYDYQIISDDVDSEGFSSVIVSSIDTSLVDALHEMSDRLNLKPLVLEPESNSLLRLINMLDIPTKTLIIDIGEMYSKFIYINGSDIEYKQIPYGVFKIDALLAMLRNTTLTNATQSRLSEGLLTGISSVDNSIDRAVDTMLSSKIEKHVEVINVTKNNFKGFDKILITGGAWNIDGFAELIQQHTEDSLLQEFNIETFELDLNNLLFKNNSAQISNEMCNYAACIGLCLRGGL